ncbi:MAG: hypothetical protein COA88_11310 [Kordia sp.]|nr:MAG: hypothetical protein COA88_11310 [Kordia sp.]
MRKEVQCSNNKRLINWRFNYMLLLKIQLTLFICLGLHIQVLGQEAQILITNPTGVNVCDASQQVDIQILNIHTGTLVNNSITIVLPTGIEYVSSSLSEQSSFNISEQNITNLSSIILSADDLSVSQTMQFSINITANMDAIVFQDAGNVFRNDVTLSYDGGSTNGLSNAYNLYYPVLSITSISPTSKNLNSGDSFTRDITIVNAGNGRVATFKINDVHASGIDVTSVNIGSLDGVGAIITLSGADFTGVGNNDNYFDTNESITITQSISGSGCDNATVTSTITNLWECSGSQIVSSNSFGHVSLSLKTPNIGVSTTSELSSCFGDSESSSHTITLTNNGQGKADVVQLDIYKSLGSSYNQNIFSRIDEANITYQLNGGSSIAITPTTTYVTDTNGDYSCLGGSPIGRVILDFPDLDSGDQILVSFKTYHCNINVCNGDYVKGWRYDLAYKDVCDNSNYSKSGTGQNENETIMSIFSETPTNINDGETKELSFTVSSFSNDLPEDTGAQYKVVFDLQAGLAYSNLDFYHNVLWTASSINYDTGANQVTAYYDLPLPSGFNITKAAFNLDVTGDCGMTGAVSGPVNITMNISYITSSSCSFEVPFICNTTETLDLHCNSGVGCEGMNFDSFSFKRTSFGSPDNDQNGLPDSSGSLDFSVVKENRVMLGDSIQGTFQGTIYTTPANTDWAYSYASQNIEKGTYLTPISASLVVYDASSASSITCAIVPVTSVVSGDDKTFTYDISPSTLASSCASFSGFVYESGDTVTLYTNYEVTTNLGGNIEQLKSTNEFYTSNIVNPGTNDKYQCGYYDDNFTLIGYSFLNSSRNYFSVTSCSKTVNQYFYLSIGDCCSNYNGGNLFPSEYRNWAHIKSATVEIPDNYDISNVVLKIWRTKKTNSSISETVTDISPSQVVGNLYTFDLEQHYVANGGSINFSDDGFKGKLSMDLAPNCDVPINTYEDLTWKFNFSKGSFLGGGDSGLLEATNPDRIKFNPPSLVLSSDNPILLGLTETISWDFKVNTNSSNINADNAWIHIKNPSGTTQIIQVIDDATGQEIPLTGDIYQLGQLTGSSARDLTIIGKYTDCIPDYITVYSGYECTAYPANFGDFTCGFSTYGLFVEPQPSGMQATLEGIHVGDICGTTIEIEIDVSSVKFGSLNNLSVSIDPVGDSMAFVTGSGQIQYPLSSSYLTISDPVLDGSNNYVYTIADIESTISANGLPGVLDLSNNHFKLKFNMEVDSSFEGGDHALVSVSSESMCEESNTIINLAFDPTIGFIMASSSGLTIDVTDSWSASWGDYNNDGYDDLFITTYDDTQPNILYENNGDETFTKISTGDIVNDTAKSLGATWGDYDNDGDLDLFVANNAGSNNFFYKNNGDTTFTKITSGDIVEYGVYCNSAAWADYDNDGYLDLFVTEYFSTNTNHLFHNNGDGTFTRVENSPVVTDAGHSIGAAWADYNNDGLVDLFVPNTNNEANWLYKNIGNGQFVKVNENVLSTPSKSVGCSWGDYNNDGYMDLFVANSGDSNNALYKNNTDGTFTEIITGDIVNDKGNSHGSTWIDIDNDGYLDLYVTNDQDENNFLYKNNGDGSFTRTENDLTEIGGDSYGTAISDYDNDGDNDIFIANHGSTNNFFFENTRGQCDNFLGLKFVGTNSNKSAIGAKIRVKANIYGQDIWQKQEILSRSGGQNSSKLLFGLGDATVVDSLVVDWPSGYRKIFTNVSASVNYDTYVEDNGTHISGISYIDENSNCIYDTGDVLLKNTKLTIAPDDKTTYTNSNGEYSFYMNTGTYTITAESPLYYTQFCPSSQEAHTATVTAIGETIPDKDFGFVADGSISDLSVSMSTTVLRKNFENDYIVTYKNIGNNAATGNRVTINLANDIDFVSSDVLWTNQTGQTAYWDIATIEAQEIVTFTVTIKVTIDTTIGDNATNSISITSNTADTNMANNTHNDTSIIVGAIDPNDKLVYPEGALPLGDPITYKIRFQNMGNYPAESIVVYDTLSSNLDISSLNKMETSHEARFTILDKNVLKWDFPHIDLQDVEHNEPDSHGYIQFEIFPKKNLNVNTNITNSATIIFDYYQITPTNITNIIVNPYRGDGQLFIYPQPTKNNIIVEYESMMDEIVHMEFYNLLGELLLRFDDTVSQGWNKFNYNISNLSPGIYIIAVRSGNKTTSKKIIKL